MNSPITYYTKSWDEEPVLMNQNFKENIIIIEGNPLENLNCIKDISMVIKDGNIVVNKSKNYA